MKPNRTESALGVYPTGAPSCSVLNTNLIKADYLHQIQLIAPGRFTGLKQKTFKSRLLAIQLKTA